MTAFVESCLGTTANSAVSVERGSRHRPRARKLLQLLQNRKNILITTHQFPDPDALASSLGMATLLRTSLKEAQVTLSVKGTIGGGLNSAFAQQTATELTPWDDSKLGQYDAIVLLDVQPGVRFSPLPPDLLPTAVIDHHRSRLRHPSCPFCDIRTDVGASASIVFSYFMELELTIPRDLAATLLFGIETDLSGAAGQPGELDNMALSSLTLLADMRKVYKMRYVDLPQSHYIAYAAGLTNAVYHDNALMSYIGPVETHEAAAVVADFLLRFDKVQWVLVTAVKDSSLLLSLRSSSAKMSAAELVRRLVRHLGEGGGHRTKAGGLIPLETGTPTEIDRLRAILRRRFLRALKIRASRGQRLVPKAE